MDTSADAHISDNHAVEADDDLDIIHDLTSLKLHTDQEESPSTGPHYDGAELKAEKVDGAAASKALIREQEKAERAKKRAEEDAEEAETYARTPCGPTSSFTFRCTPTPTPSHVQPDHEYATAQTAVNAGKRLRGIRMLEMLSEQKIKQPRLSPVLQVDKAGELSGSALTTVSQVTAKTEISSSNQSSPTAQSDQTQRLDTLLASTGGELDHLPLEAGLEAALIEIRSLQQEIASLKQASESTGGKACENSQAGTIKAAKTTAAAELRKLQQEHKALKAEHRKLQTQLADERRIWEKAAKANRSAVMAADKTAEDLKSVKKAFTALVGKQTSLKARTKEHAAANTTLQTELAGLKKQLAKEQQEGAQWKKEKASFLLALDKAKKSLPDKGKIADTTVECTKLRAQIVSLTQSRDDNKAQAAKHRLALATALKQLDATTADKEELARCRKDLAEVQKDMKKTIVIMEQSKTQSSKYQSRYDVEVDKAKQAATAHALLAAAHLRTQKQLEEAEKAKTAWKSRAEELIVKLGAA